MGLRQPACTVAALMLAGCGGQHHQAAAAPSPGPGAALESAVRAYSAAVLGGRAEEGFALLSERCRKVITVGGFAQLVAQARHTYPTATLTSVHVDKMVRNGARVSYHYSVALLDQTRQHWVAEATGWHWDAC